MAPSSQPPVLIEKPLLNSIPDSLVQRFDPTYVAYHNKYNAGRLATHQVPIEAYRANPLAYTITYGRQIVDTGDIVITEDTCPVKNGSITIRIFQPNGKPVAPRPVYINFHGGGWVFGGLATDNDYCKRLVHDLGCVAFDVDYRLAPEFPFPVPVEDCWKAFCWVRERATTYRLDLSRIAIGGCSAGGHLSAIIAHRCRDAAIPLALQVLGVPVCDLHVFTPTGELRADCPYPSYHEMYHTQPLPAERMAYFHNHFVGCPRAKELDEDWNVSPIKAPNFEGLAPALIVTAEMDVLRDEGEAYGQKMKDAGSVAEIVRINGAPHTFMLLDGILDIGQQYNKLAVDSIRRAFGVQS